MVKRIVDLVISILLFVVLFAPFLIVLVLVAIVNGRPIFFVQERPGIDGESFRLFKFRTMTQQSNTDSEMLTDKERLTNFGRVLRRFSLDELPQLINVIKGDMSLVGPRPLLMEYLPLYSEQQAKRHNVKPGITGWAQVNGRNALSWEDKFSYDTWYVENQSLMLDFKILIMTIFQVFSGRNTNNPGREDVEYFKGSQK